MAVGANLKYSGSQRAKWDQIWKLLKKHASSGKTNTRPRVCHKAGAPATNTTADDPGRVGVFCLDVTNDDVYVCSAYTNSTTFTWVKIAG